MRLATSRFPRRASFRSAALAALAALALLGACERYFPTPLPPAAYARSPVGTIFRYQGFSNRVLAHDGWLTRFEDDSGRAVNRVGGFITEDPAHPVKLDESRLAQLWPLKVGTEVTIPVTVGAERWSWDFKVTGEQLIETAAGRFRTFVVEAVQSRLDSAGGPPAKLAYTLNYAPAVNMVVRFQTTILAGKEIGRSFGSELRSVFHPDSLLAKPDSAAGK